jgi:DNA-binding transcriptional regulator YiaG
MGGDLLVSHLGIPLRRMQACLRFGFLEAMTKSAQSARYKRFLAKLRASREDAGLTQTDVARALGRPQSFVSKCESGERRVDVVELALFADLYRKPLEFFVGR